jgi:hypothetical protein
MLRRPVKVGTRVERIDQGQGTFATSHATSVSTEIGPRWYEGQLQRKARARADRRKGSAHMLRKLTPMTGWPR